ncbi:MAG: SMC-Scp complex subunit ScpB [Bryobacteraceae bacterium]|nr:SMC-Scp complex subunit ScpB [Bryobacteraceae bacterium]
MEERSRQAAGEQPETNETVRPQAEGEAAGEAPEPGAAAPPQDPAVADAPAREPAESGPEPLTAEELLGGEQGAPAPADAERARLKAVLEAIVYVLNEPMPAAQIAQALGRPVDEVEPLLKELAEDTARPDRGIFIREVAGGYQMATKPEHHEVIRNFVRNLKQPLKLSQAALETLAVIAYKQPITLPEILEIRGVQGAGVIKTLLERKLITTAGRKNVVGRPILYKTTREFLTQFGLKDLSELPSLKEFEEIRRQSMADEEFEPAPEAAAAADNPAAEAAQGAQAEESAPAEAAADAAVEPAQDEAQQAASGPPEEESHG